MLATIEDAREKLYGVLKVLGPGYHDRAEISRAIGKNRLNPVETSALDLLVSDGRIEKTTQLVGGNQPGGNVGRWVYRLVGEPGPIHFEGTEQPAAPTLSPSGEGEPFSLSAQQAGTLLGISSAKFKALAAAFPLPEQKARNGSQRWRKSDVELLKGKA